MKQMMVSDHIMGHELYVAAAGLVWWGFFEWMRGWKRNLQRSTQHLSLMAALGLLAVIVGIFKLLFDRIF